MSGLIPVLAFVWQLIISALSPQAETRMRYFGFERRTFYEVVGILTALCAIGMTVEGAYRVLRKWEQLATQKRQLALLVQRGHELRSRCADTHGLLPVEDIEQWTMDIKTALDGLGSGYAADFTKPLARPTPISVIETTGTIQTIIPSRLHYDQWKHLGYRVERLEEYLAKLSSN